jgi:hypothetical protein
MTAFESQVCPRCGGSGRFSFNLMDGNKCYGCHGSGRKLTKRGLRASASFSESLVTPLADIQVGGFVYTWTHPGAPDRWHKITEVRPAGVTFNTKSGPYAIDGTEFKYVASESDRQAKLAAALAYQETLTKQGKPRKAAVSSPSTLHG